MTGTIGGTLLVVAGLLILPHRRQRLKRELTTKIETLREELARSLADCFGEEVRRYAAQLRAVFTPERDAARARVDGLREAEGRVAGFETERRRLLERIA